MWMLSKVDRKIFKKVFSRKPTTRVSAILSLVHVHSIFNTPRVRVTISRKLRKNFGIFISPDCRYGTNFRIKHPVGVVVGSGVRIGNNVTIFQNVTLGGRRLGDGGGEKYPTIDDGTVIFGNVRVGKNCVIGANAVVLKDIPDDSTAVGVPATVLINKETGE